jgi:hypothetical protein
MYVMWWYIWEILRTYRYELYVVSFGLRLMQWHEYCIFPSTLKGYSELLARRATIHCFVVTTLQTYYDYYQIHYVSHKKLQRLVHTICRLEQVVDFGPTSIMTIRVQCSQGHPLVALCFQAHKENVCVCIGSKVHGIRPVLPSRGFYMQICIVQLVLSLYMAYPITHTTLKLVINLCNIFRYYNFERELITIVNYLWCKLPAGQIVLLILYTNLFYKA